LFLCSLCGRNAPARTKPVRVVIEKRARVYPPREKANVAIRRDKAGRPKKVLVDDPGGRGLETVREALACAACAASRP
jgi:hypothetical protein